jgi:hypothetical protein
LTNESNDEHNRSSLAMQLTGLVSVGTSTSERSIGFSNGKDIANSAVFFCACSVWEYTPQRGGV